MEGRSQYSPSPGIASTVSSRGMRIAVADLENPKIFLDISDVWRTFEVRRMIVKLDMRLKPSYYFLRNSKKTFSMCFAEIVRLIYSFSGIMAAQMYRFPKFIGQMARNTSYGMSLPRPATGCMLGFMTLNGAKLSKAPRTIPSQSTTLTTSIMFSYLGTSFRLPQDLNSQVTPV